jgi:hypothetical protein
VIFLMGWPLAFYRSVGATYYVQRAESLLAEFK